MPLGTVFKKDDEQSQRIKEIIAKLSVKYEVGQDIVLLAWILKHPAGIMPVCGTSEPSRLSNLMKSVQVDMSLQEWFAVLSESLGTEVP